jgi:hypothetical protein
MKVTAGIRLNMTVAYVTPDNITASTYKFCCKLALMFSITYSNVNHNYDKKLLLLTKKDNFF